VGRRRLIDPDDLPDDLLAIAAQKLAEIALDPAGVAAYMGLVSADALAVYISRYDDFPEPWISRGRYIKLWLPTDIDAFLERHPQMGRKRPT
jgi:hypothetical protein